MCSAAWIGPGVSLQALFLAQVAHQPGRGHGTGRQAGHADELFELGGVGVDENLLEVAVRVAFFGDGKGRAYLHGVGPVSEPVPDLLVAADAAERKSTRLNSSH